MPKAGRRQSNNRSTPYGCVASRLIPQALGTNRACVAHLRWPLCCSGGGSRDADAAKRVFVGNLSYKTSWQDLKDHMKSIGEVAYCDIIPDAENKSLSSGSALVEYVSAKQAARAIRELNHSEIDGWKIHVREDRVGMPIGMVTNGGSVDRASVFGAGMRRGGGGGGRSGGGGGGGGGGAKVVIRTKGNVVSTAGGGGGGLRQRQIFVGNLPNETTWQNLKDVFKTMGEVERAEILGRGGSGTVLMATAKQAAAAIKQFDKADFDGRIINVKLDEKA